MRLADVEAWALGVIDRVEKGHPIEDSRVELKAEFPEDELGWRKWARRIAGHANAARGEPVLWLIGVNEKQRTVPGAGASDAAAWWPRVRKHFDGVAPRLVDLAVPHGNVTVMALFFETDRAPFVVRNPDGGAVQFEVPWRDGTSVRSARREDLIRVLVPRSRAPSLEVLRAVADPIAAHGRLGFLFTLYLTPATSERVTLPLHRCAIEGVVGATKIELDELSFEQGHLLASSPSLEVTPSEILATGPGRVLLRARATTAYAVTPSPMTITLKLGIAGADTAALAEVGFEPVVTDGKLTGWRWHDGTTVGPAGPG